MKQFDFSRKNWDQIKIAKWNNLNFRAKNWFKNERFWMFKRQFLTSKCRFLAWKFKYLIHLRMKNSTNSSEFLAQKFKLVLSKSNFWTKKYVLTHSDNVISYRKWSWKRPKIPPWVGTFVPSKVHNFCQISHLMMWMTNAIQCGLRRKPRLFSIMRKWWDSGATYAWGFWDFWAI